VPCITLSGVLCIAQHLVSSKVQYIGDWVSLWLHVDASLLRSLERASDFHWTREALGESFKMHRVRTLWSVLTL
jgi:hypothetical protein